MAVSGRVQGPPLDGDIEQYSQHLGQWILTSSPFFTGSVNYSVPINLVDNNGVVRAQIDSISGDLWLLSNAIWNPNDGQGGNFYRIDPTHAAFGLQLQGQGFIPGEPNLGYYVAGCTTWVAQPESYTLIRGGGLFANPIFNVVGGWELGSTVTQQRQMTIGGGGIEIDGYGLIPYVRVVNNDTGTVLHKIMNGMVRNAFTDLSGYDDPTQESWYWGYLQEYNPANGQPAGSSRWSVAYIPPNTSPTSGILYEYLKITPASNVAIVEVTQNPTTPLGVATKQYVDAIIPASTPRGHQNSAVGPAAQTDVSTITTVMTVPVTLTTGRRYKVSAESLVSQQTATGNLRVSITDSAGYYSARVVSVDALASTFGAAGSGFYAFVATATASVNFLLQGQTSAGVCRFVANSSQLIVEDIGT